MLRDYKNGLSEDIGVFSGKEIEHTPAYGLQTLFIVRNDLTFDQIQSLCVHTNAEAIYYGANRSFMLNHGMQIGQIMQFLQRGYHVTVDYPYSLHNEIQKQFNLVWNHEKFIPFCSIIFPYVNKDEKGDIYRLTWSRFIKDHDLIQNIKHKINNSTCLN